MVGVLKADADSLGDAIRRLPAGDGPARLKALSNALDGFFAETLEGEMASARSPWPNIYTVFSGGDDLLAVGPWDLILDFAGHIQELFTRRFGPGVAASPSPTPLTISAAVTIVKPRYPLHLAAQQADKLLEDAKNALAPGADQPKDQCAALGELWKWRDHGAIVRAGKRLADWVQGAGSGRAVVERGWLATLLELALLRGGRAGPKYAGIHPATATSRLAYHVERNWPRKRETPRDDGERAGNAARQWIEDILGEFEHLESSRRPDAVFLRTVVRYAMLATRPSSDKE
jgi:CRISPR-associated protein Csm1